MLLAMYFTLTKTTLIATFGHKYNKSLMALKKLHAAKGNLKIHSILHSVYCLNYLLLRGECLDYTGALYCTSSGEINLSRLDTVCN